MNIDNDWWLVGREGKIVFGEMFVSKVKEGELGVSLIAVCIDKKVGEMAASGFGKGGLCNEVESGSEG